MGNNIIELKNVYKRFGDTVVLNDIDLQIEDKEFVTILGPSGCGKTTVLRIISGLEYPDMGNVFISGKDVTKMHADSRKMTNMVFQNYALFPHMTVFDNVAFGLVCRRKKKAEIYDRVIEMLDKFRIRNLLDRKPSQLSGGQQQRVAIARAVINEPLVLLLDEPLSALDRELRKDMQIELKQIQSKLNITFVLVTHDQEEALMLSDKVIIMRHGKLEQIGTPRDVYENPRNLYVANFIGEANIFYTEVISTDNDCIYANIEDKEYKFKNKCNEAIHSGQKIRVVIRPEDIAVWREHEIDMNEKERSIESTVTQVIYKGSTVDLTLSTTYSKKIILATEFFNEDDEKLDYQINEMVWINWIHGWEVVI